MKRFFKLTFGEIKKLAKNYTLAIMAGVLALVIGLFTFLYATTSSSDASSTLSLIARFLAGEVDETTVDAFDIIDTALNDIDSLGVSVDDATKQQILDVLDDDKKLMLLNQSPSKMRIITNPAYHALLADDTILDQLLANNFELTAEYILTDTNYANFLNKTLTSVAALTDSQAETQIRQDVENHINNMNLSDLKNDLLASMDIVKDLTVDIYRGIADSSLMSMQDFVFFVIYNSFIGAQDIDDNLHKSIYSAYSNQLSNSSYALKQTKEELEYFESNNFEKSYIDFMVAQTELIGQQWQEFCSAIEDFEADASDENFATLRNAFSLVYNQVWTVSYYYGETDLLSTKYLLFDKDRGAFETPQTIRDINSTFRRFYNRASAASSTYTRIGSENTAYNNIVGLYPRAAEFLQNEMYLPENTQTFLVNCQSMRRDLESAGALFEKYNPSNLEGATMSHSQKLEPIISKIQMSYAAPISQKTYDDLLKDYEQELDKTDELYADIKSGTLSYSELSRTYKSYVSRQQTFSKLLLAVNMLQTFDELDFNDSNIANIYGMMFSSRYELRTTITKSQYYIKNGELAIDYGNFSGLTNGYGYMEFSFIIISVFILIFGIFIGAGTIAGEHSDGTMKLLLIRPYTRTQILMAKILAAIIILFVFYLLSFAITFLIGGIGWGFGVSEVLSIFNATVPLKLNSLTVMLISYGTAFFEALIYLLIAVVISTVFKSRAGAVSVSMVVYLLSWVLNALMTMLLKQSWYRFVVFNNTNLSMYFGSGPLLNDMSFFFSLIVDAVYLLVFAFVAFFTFCKRDAT